MIGNIVGYSSLTRMVTAINPPYFIDLGNGERTTITNVCIEHLNPIPITEELLLKNGFNLGCYDVLELNFYTQKINGCHVNIEFECGYDTYLCHIQDNRKCTIASADIKYVHQMQNLLAICGIEWKVEL